MDGSLEPAAGRSWAGSSVTTGMGRDGGTMDGPFERTTGGVAAATRGSTRAASTPLRCIAA